MRSECLSYGKISNFIHFLYSIIICIPQPLNLLDMILLISLIGTLPNKNVWRYRHSTYSPIWGPWEIYIWFSLLKIPTIYSYVFYFQLCLKLWKSSLLFSGIIKFIRLVGTLIQTRIGVGTVWSHSSVRGPYRVNMSSLWQTPNILYDFYIQLLFGYLCS